MKLVSVVKEKMGVKSQNRWKIRNWIFIIFLWSHPVTSQTNQNVLKLMNDIFTNYSSKVRPMISQERPLPLDVSFYLSSINEVSEVKEKLVTTGYIMLEWIDELLRWTPEDYNYTEMIFIPQVIKSKINRKAN